MELRQLEYVIAVEETLSFTRAAKRCSVVQSALSHQVSKLERELGITLFERTSRSVTVTPAGRTFLAFAHRVIDELGSARTAMAELLGVVTGELRIGMFGASLRIPGVEESLAQFYRAHPGVEIRISDRPTDELLTNLMQGELDLAFLGDTPDARLPDDLRVVTLSDDPLVAVMAPSNPLADRATVSLAEIAAAGPTIELVSGNGLRRVVDRAFTVAGVERRVIVEMPSLEDVTRFAALGLGTALVRRPYVQRIPPELDCRVVALSPPGVRLTIKLAFRAARSTSPAAHAYLSVLFGMLETAGINTAFDPAGSR